MQTDDKPRLVRVTDPKEIDAARAGANGDLACPRGLPSMNSATQEVHWYADSAELAKWREAQKP